MPPDAPLPPAPPPSEGERTQFLLKYAAWLRVLATHEIHRRFAGKFDPSDVVQQTLFEAWQGWERMQAVDEAQRLAWLRQVLAHQLAHFIRRHRTQMRDAARELSLDATLCQSSQRLGALLHARDPTPSGAAIAVERQIALARALESLSEDYRQVILLRNFDDLPHHEVARRMGRSEAAVRMLWLRALAALSTALRELGIESGAADGA